jgi:hypothetical protein
LVEGLDESPQNAFCRFAATLITPAAYASTSSLSFQLIIGGWCVFPSLSSAIIIFPSTIIDTNNETEIMAAAMCKRAFCLVAMAYTHQQAMAFQHIAPIQQQQQQQRTTVSVNNRPVIGATAVSTPLRMSSSDDDGGVSVLSASRSLRTLFWVQPSTTDFFPPISHNAQILFPSFVSSPT